MRDITRASKFAQLSDDEREKAIFAAWGKLADAFDNPKKKEASWTLLRDLVNSRSQKAVARLERKRSLGRYE